MCLERIIIIIKDMENIKIKLFSAGGNVIKFNGSVNNITEAITIKVAPILAI
ncbi:MAG: hypothetical protein H6613_03690 [Ignavibacteriales bacterium]|nr:hypothetical protein [Ignavibacteriales bacterium]